MTITILKKQHQYKFNSLYIVLFCLFSGTLFSQNALQNFEKQYNSAPANSSSRYLITGKYAQALFFNDQPEKAFNLISQNIKLAEKNKLWKYAAYLFCIQSMTYKLDENSTASLQGLEKAKETSRKANDPETFGYVQYCEGWLNIRSNKETQAVKNLLSAANFYQKSANSTTLLPRMIGVYRELNSLYANWNEFELQEKYGKLALQVAQKINSANDLFDANMMMGYMYEQKLNKDPKNKHYRDLTEKHYLQAITLYSNNKESNAVPSNLSFAAINLANLYLKFFPPAYRNKAFEYANLAKDISEKSGNATHIASSYGILSEIATENNDNTSAKNYLLSALNVMNGKTLTDYHTKLSILESLTDISEKDGNYAEALRYHKLYTTTFQYIYDQDKVNIGKNLEAQYEKELQKQKYIRLQLESDKKEQKLQLMKALGIQQTQELHFLKLTEENQRKKLQLSELRSESRAQELTLSKLENLNHNKDLNNFKKELSYKEKINNYFVILIIFFALLLAMLLYLYKQRSKSMKQREDLYQFEIDKERQNSKISTLTALLEGEELERSRLARDLHDGLGGLLSSTKIQLSNLNETTKDDTKIEMSKSIKQLDDAVDELRRVAHNLMPDLLLKYGLHEALKEYATRMSSKNLDIDVQFLSYTESLSKESQLLVYRIVQELVNNSVKHANAKEIIIQLVEEEKKYSVTVEDDGKGFDMSKINFSKSAGFHNIQTRIERLKGTFNFYSDEKLGTSVDFHFPKN